MAWEFVNVNGWVNTEFNSKYLDFIQLKAGNGPYTGRNDIITVVGTSDVRESNDGEVIYSRNGLTLQHRYELAGSGQVMLGIALTLPNGHVLGYNYTPTADLTATPNVCGLAFVIDTNNSNRAQAILVWQQINVTYTTLTEYVGDLSDSANLRAWIDANPPAPPYSWQSVPSISGKNGILQNLVQIKEEAINDGEPVSEATVLSFDSLGNINIPSVIDEQMPVDPSDVTSVTATYLIPALENGTYEGIKLLVKKGSIPTSEEDADKVVNLDEPTSILRIDSKSVGNLDEDSHYYFMVKLIDELGTEATSDPKDIWTSHSEGWSFDYTGEIQTFVAPKTGVYQLETWGAQGGDATDGTLTARGGYGAYAYGEVLLQQGDTIYINVGGQNGYGGGGNPVTNIINIIENNTYNPDATPQGIDITNNVAAYAISSGSGSWTLVNSQLSEYLLTNKTLICYMSGNIRYALTSDGIFRRSSNRSSMATHTFIPVNRQINLQKLLFKHKDYSRYGDYFQGTVGVGYVENGEFKMGATMDLDLRSTTVSDWTSKEIDLSSVPYIDYIYIVWYDGCEDFKDFEIEYI